MNLRLLLATAAVAATFNASAQWIADSVDMNAGYAKDVYYSLQNGTQNSVANTDWHIGFQVTPQGPYGNVSVIANHVQGGVKVYHLNKAASASWATLTGADTVGKTSTQVYNSDTSWNYGAFSHATDPSNLLDYGWGNYNMTSHNVEGDSIFLLKIGSAGAAYKFCITKYVSNPADSVKWTFRIAPLTGAGDTTIDIRVKDYTNRMFAYYNATTRTVSDREVSRFSWDLLFTRYVGMATQGSVTIPYNLTGVLSNFGVSVADVRGVNPDTAHMYGRTFTKNMSEIGSDWKTFNMAAMPPRYDMDTTATFFIRTNNTQEYWQMKFTGFDYTVGKVYFSKRFLNTTAVNTINNTVANYYVYPQPATNAVSVMIDTKDATSGATLMLTDLAGRTVYSQPVTLNTGINTFSVPTANMPTGMYVLAVAGRNLKLAQKITVAH